MFTNPESQHQWLKQLVGTWEGVSQCSMGPDKPTETMKGTETVRMFGDLWLVAEGRSETPGGGVVYTLTVGYDPLKKKFVGSWICDKMATLYVYEGELDTAQRMLPLTSKGPSFLDSTKTATYQDVIELQTPDRRLFWSQVLGDDGKWTRFMNATYTRVK